MMHPRALLACSTVLAMASVAAFQPRAWTQAQETHAQRAERFRQMSLAREKDGLAEPFKGITTNGSLQPGLFGIKSTGVSTEPVRRAADRLLAALTKEQRDKTLFAVGDDEWRKWMNQDYYVRQGVSFLEMTDAQRQGTIDLTKAGVMGKGMTTALDTNRS